MKIISTMAFLLAISFYGQSQALKEVKIGNQVWMAENLDVETFRNGDPIPQAKNFDELAAYSRAKEAAYCYYEFNLKNRKEYRKMYNGYAMLDPRGLAPEGWRIPNEDDFRKLVEHLGGQDPARFKLKSNSGWKENKNGTNSSGFTGLPGGQSAGPQFLNVGFMTDFWSTSPMGVDGFYYVMGLSYNDEKEHLEIGGETTTTYKHQMFYGNYVTNFSYVRCIKD